MTEKRYKYNKYVDCYCLKHKQIMVGTQAYMYLNIFAAVFGGPVMLWILTSGVYILHKLTFVFVVGIPIFIIPFFDYRIAKKTMLEAGHSDICSQKIALMAASRASLWSDKLKIMKDKDEGRRVRK